jgi:hypothetical protein
MPRKPLPDPPDEYAVIRLRISWGLVSILAFALALPCRYLLRLVPAVRLPDPLMVLWLWIPVTLALALLGVLCALLGLRQEPRTIAKIGLLLNSAILLVLVGTALFVRHLWWR